MDQNTVIAVVVAAAIAAVLGGVVVKLLDHLRKKDAETEAKRILERAALESSSHRK